MRQSILLALFFCLGSTLQADSPNTAKKAPTKHFEAFTGKITGHNVRMRLQPSLDAPVFKELAKDDLVLVTDQSDEFYACMPPKGLKGYIFRTYVLDGVVEGSNVFVRLGPDRSSPSVAQLNSGDLVKGTISQENSKWLQIELPADTRFYVAKDYVQRVGDSHYFDEILKRKNQLANSLNDIEQDLNRELSKPFPKIHLAPISARLTQFINDNKDMTQAVAQAEGLISRMQESYLAKSVAFGDEELPQPITPQVPAPAAEKPKNVPQNPPPAAAKPLTVSSWKDHEEAIIASSKASSSDAFYAAEKKNANTMHGIIKPYSTFIATRPGDYVLLNLKTNLPIAYLYSTKIDLAANCNKPVTIWVSPRPNNNFAFPAFFVHQVEE